MNNGRYGLLGKSLKHSVSPQLHKYLGDYSYDLIVRDEEGVKRLFTDHEYDGFNVTIPYKLLAYSLCDELDENAKAIGSVNTVVFDSDGHSKGFNTDAFGFEYLLRANNIDVKEKNCLILGSGGAFLTVKHILGLHNAESITVCTRSVKMFNEKYNITNIQVTDYDELYERSGHGPIAEYEVIINTTPVGMYSFGDDYLNDSPIDLRIFNNVNALVDIIYNPVQTKLCKQAEELGIKWTSGLRMLIGQGYKAGVIFNDNMKGNRI